MDSKQITLHVVLLPFAISFDFGLQAAHVVLQLPKWTAKEKEEDQVANNRPVSTATTAEEIFNEIKKMIIEDHDPKFPNQVTRQASVMDDNIKMDSLDLVEYVMQLEEVYEVELPETVIENWECIGDAVDCIQALREEKAKQTEPA